MRYLITTLFTFVCLYSYAQKKTPFWTQENQAKLYLQFYKESAIVFKNESDRKQFAECAVKKAKSISPNGYGNYTATQIENIGAMISESCANEIGRIDHLRWSPNVEAELRKMFENSKQFEVFSQAVRKEIASCLVLKLKALYPKAIPSPIPNEALEVIGSACSDDIIKKHK